MEKPVYSKVHIPSHVKEEFRDIKTLWNSVEKFEKRKDSQVGLDFVLGLPDDKCVSLDDKIYLVEKFIETHFVSKGYGAHTVIHQPDKRSARVSENSGKTEERDHNWHCHVLLTLRAFNESRNSFNEKKSNDLLPNVRGATHFALDGVRWGKVRAQFMNDYFEEKGLSLRVDPEGIVPGKHLGPVRMRGSKVYADLERQENNAAVNQIISKDSSLVLEKITETKIIFTIQDVENYFRKHVPENEMSQIREEFWKSEKIVELFKENESLEEGGLRKFSAVSVVNTALGSGGIKRSIVFTRSISSHIVETMPRWSKSLLEYSSSLINTSFA